MHFRPMHFTTKYGSSEERSSLPIPTIYESIPAQQAKWEYHLLIINTAEAELPSVEQLNALGIEGWVLVSVLDAGASGRGKLVHYYFVRQDVKA
jgi:hypothetical protein